MHQSPDLTLRFTALTQRIFSVSTSSPLGSWYVSVDSIFVWSSSSASFLCFMQLLHLNLKNTNVTKRNSVTIKKNMGGKVQARCSSSFLRSLNQTVHIPQSLESGSMASVMPDLPLPSQPHSTATASQQVLISRTANIRGWVGLIGWLHIP